MRTPRALPAFACLMLPVLAAARGPDITLPSFAGLKQSAQDSDEITFGPLSLRLLDWAIDDSDADGKRLKRTLRGLRSVQIRSYEFKDGFEYPTADLDALRAQLMQPAWSQLLKVRDRDNKQNLEVYVALQNHTVKGLTVIDCGPRELTVINIVGSMDLDEVDGVRKMFDHSDNRHVQVSQRTP